MRTEYISGSAGALVIGVMSLVLGYALTPLPQDGVLTDALRNLQETSDQWLASSALLFLASIGMTLGTVALLSLLDRRERGLRVIAAAVYAVGTIAMTGYATALIFLRALVLNDLLALEDMSRAGDDAGVVAFITIFLGCFSLGVVLLAIGMLRARSVPRWIPILMLLFVASQFVPFDEGKIGTVIQFLVLAVACTGAAVAANDRAHLREADAAQPG